MQFVTSVHTEHVQLKHRAPYYIVGFRSTQPKYLIQACVHSCFSSLNCCKCILLRLPGRSEALELCQLVLDVGGDLLIVVVDFLIWADLLLNCTTTQGEVQLHVLLFACLHSIEGYIYI